LTIIDGSGKQDCSLSTLGPEIKALTSNGRPVLVAGMLLLQQQQQQTNK
jgi:hypothetical protein